ncbi:MAG: hypothetical protein V4713_03830 [Pseudomonadota bacterium]
MSARTFLVSLTSKLLSNRKLVSALFVVAFYVALYQVFGDVFNGAQWQENIPLHFVVTVVAILFFPVLYRAHLAVQADADKRFLESFTTTYKLESEKIIVCDEHDSHPVKQD